MSFTWWFMLGNILSGIFAFIVIFILFYVGVGFTEGTFYMVMLALYLFCFIKIYPKYFKYKTKEDKIREAQEALKNGILILDEGSFFYPKIAIDTRQRTFIHGNDVYPLGSIRSWNEHYTTNPGAKEPSYYLELHFKEINHPYVQILMSSKMTLKSTMEALQQVINEGKTTV